MTQETGISTKQSSQEHAQIDHEDNSSNTPIADDTVLDTTIEDLKASLARSQADYQNLIMRTDRDKAEMIHFLSAKIFVPLLSQIDHLDRAIEIKK